MRIESTDDRQRLREDRLEATDPSAKSKALGDDTEYYCRMRGDVAGYRAGKIEGLLQVADDRDSLTASEIATLLDTRELPITLEIDGRVGDRTGPCRRLCGKSSAAITSFRVLQERSPQTTIPTSNPRIPMIGWSPTRRSFLRGLSVTTVGIAGCSTIIEQESGAIDLYLINDTDAEVFATIQYESCEQIGPKQLDVGDLNPGYYHFSGNDIVANSGPCSIEVSTRDGLSDRYEWTVGERTLVIRIKPDAIEFNHRPPDYDPASQPRRVSERSRFRRAVQYHSGLAS